MPIEYTAILEQLTGPSRVAETRLFENKILALMDRNGNFRFAKGQDRDEGELELALLRRSESDYSISASDDQDFGSIGVWLNRLISETEI